ncbi:MAG TPA: outer membrane beta-barrel protein [Verrucomicrobiae bacterium]|nr:outer membrane beta-barrel protein [Verrucomicrobiae bacterium]
MKLNKWTLGLAALGVISLAGAARADEKPSSVMTALSSTVLSGYVDTSMEWNPGTGNANPAGFKFNKGKQDGFNLDVVKVTLERPLDESEWAAGYKVDLLFGPDANVLGTTSTGTTADFAIKQAYVALRAPIGNGLDFKIGVFDSIIGYESFEASSNPNFTRSYGHTIEPSTHTGVLATYRVNSNVAFAVGVANTVTPTINSRAFGANAVGAPPKAESYKAYMASAALTAPDGWGFVSGSTLYAGVVNGFNNLSGADQVNFYAGLTLATPIKELRVGASYDYAGAGKQASFVTPYYANATDLYASYQASEKLSLHARAEYFTATPKVETLPGAAGLGIGKEMMALTGTVQYDLWKNVISRLEVRWDHTLDDFNAFGGTTVGAPTRGNWYTIAANVIYKF